jgi:hypothetical protein
MTVSSRSGRFDERHGLEFAIIACAADSPELPVG